MTSLFGKYWPKLPTQCWAGLSSCLGNGKWTYVNNSAGQVFVKILDVNFRPVIRSLVVDTRCHVDNYNQYCDYTLGSRVSVGEVPLDPVSLYVNLRGGSTVNFTVLLPDFKGTAPANSASYQLGNVSVLDVVILQDNTGFGSSSLFDEVAVKTIHANLQAFGLKVKSDLASRGTLVNLGYAYWTGSAVSTSSKTFDVDSVSSSTFLGLKPSYSSSTGHVLTGLSSFAADTNFNWNKTKFDSDYMRIVIVVTPGSPSGFSAWTTLTANLQAAQIYPLIYSPNGAAYISSSSGMKRYVEWTKVTDITPSWPSGFTASNSWVALLSSDIGVSGTCMISSVYFYVWPNPPYLFFTTDKNYTSGNNYIFVTVNDKCYCIPPIKNAVAPPGYYLCNDPDMPCSDAWSNSKLSICHLPNCDASKGNTLSIGPSGWNGHGGDSCDFVGSCDCFVYAADGSVMTLFKYPPQSLYPMNSTEGWYHFYGIAYSFGHTIRNAYVTVPSKPTPTAEQLINATAGQLLVVDFLDGPDMTIDQNGYLHNFQITYVGYTGAVPSDPSIKIYEYPSNASITMDTSTGTTARTCPRYNGTGIQLTPACPPSGYTDLLIRYRICNGCFCSQGLEGGTQSTDPNQGTTLLRIRVNCPVNYAPYCSLTPTKWINGGTIQVYPSVNGVGSFNLSTVYGDDNLGDPARFTVTNVNPSISANASIDTDGILTTSVKAGTSNNTVITVTYNVNDTKLVSNASCTVYFNVSLLKANPEISLWPNAAFVTPRETVSNPNVTVTVSYNANTVVTLYGTAAWVNPLSQISWVNINDANILTSTNGLTPLATINIGASGNGTAVISWRPTMTHVDGATSTLYLWASASNPVLGTVTSANTTITFTVTPNNAPLSNKTAAPFLGTNVTTNEDTAVTFTVRCTDIDSYHTYVLNNTLTTSTSNGGIVKQGSTFNLTGYIGTAQNYTYTPNADWSGVDSFTYTCTDLLGKSVTDTIYIVVAAVNDIPTCVNYSVPGFFVTPGKATDLPQIAGSDIDAGSVLKIKTLNISQALNGALTLTSTAVVDGTLYASNGVGTNTWYEFLPIDPLSFRYTYVLSSLGSSPTLARLTRPSPTRPSLTVSTTVLRTRPLATSP